MTDSSVKMLVSALNSESHHTFRDLDLRYDYIGSNQENFMTLANLTGLHYLRVHALEELKNVDEVVKGLESLIQLKYLFWVDESEVDSLDFEPEDSLVKAMTHLTDLRFLNLD